MARAQRRQGLNADAAATASSGARIHPGNPAIARELALALVALGRYEEARGPADLATDTYRNDIELLMAYGRVWEPVNPDAAQWAFRLATKLNPGCEEAKFAYDCLLYPPQGRGTILLPDRNPARRRRRLPHHAAPRAHRGDHSREVRRRLRRVLPPLLVGVARSLFPGARWGSSCSTSASVIGVRVYMAAQISIVQPNPAARVRLSFMRLGGRFPELRAKAIACVYAVVIVGFFLICIMSGLS